MRVVLADDHKMVRDGLKFFLAGYGDIEIVGEAVDGEEAVAVVAEAKPDIVLMDLRMPRLSGIEAAKRIRSEAPHTQVIMLTSFEDQLQVLEAIEAGVAGYQLKDVEPEELVDTIYRVHRGERVIHPRVTSHVLKRLTRPSQESPLKELTKRERDVLAEISCGRSNREIALTLSISEKTVKTHVSHILSKLEVKDRTQAALLAIEHKEELHQKS
ncbi:response regulator transcription factor [Paenalkalicoccus suaedae]|uniref:Response regulator transcription factor n=1 Tax=Paenalkalicoccus suaedae TaxID=2592382 RepID=A0A859FJY9_9BACI|nr:response regulator transcription factor [Paenalkalicoccus suaedae]